MDLASRSAENRIFYGTRARRAILLLLRTGRRYFSASEIHQSLKAEMPSTAMSTVYRTLEMLEGFGTVSRRAEEGKEATFVYCGGTPSPCDLPGLRARRRCSMRRNRSN